MALKLSKPLFSFELSADRWLNDLFPATEFPGPSFPGFELCLPKTATAFGGSVSLYTHPTLASTRCPALVTSHAEDLIPVLGNSFPS